MRERRRDLDDVADGYRGGVVDRVYVVLALNKNNVEDLGQGFESEAARIDRVAAFVDF